MKNLNSLVLMVVMLLAIAVLGALALLITGCDEGMNMAKDVVSPKAEPEDQTPEKQTPVIAGDMKQPEETVTGETEEATSGEMEGSDKSDTDPTEAEEEPGETTEEPTEPTPPKDTTPPTVLSVEWYHNQQMTEPIVENVSGGDTMFAIVTFSEAVQHIAAEDDTARPSLSIIIGGLAIRLSIVSHDADIKSGEVKPISDDTYLCKYTLRARAIGSVALRVEADTVDMAGNMAAGTEYRASFKIKPPPTVVRMPVEIVPALKTLLPATPLEQQPPEGNPGDFIGQVRTLYSTSGILVNSTRPIAGVSVTITAGPRDGEQVTTDQGGYYLFPNSNEDVLYLRVEKEHFEPKEVIVHRVRPTVSQRPTGPVLNRDDPWNTPGTIVMGQKWPDEVRFIFEETLLPNDVLFVRDDGYKSFELFAGQYYFSGKLSGIVAISADRVKTNNEMLMLLPMN